MLFGFGSKGIGNLEIIIVEVKNKSMWVCSKEWMLLEIFTIAKIPHYFISTSMVVSHLCKKKEEILPNINCWPTIQLDYNYKDWSTQQEFIWNQTFLFCYEHQSQFIYLLLFTTTYIHRLQWVIDLKKKILHKFTVSNNNNKRSKKWRGDLRKPPGLYWEVPSEMY